MNTDVNLRETPRKLTVARKPNQTRSVIIEGVGELGQPKYTMFYCTQEEAEFIERAFRVPTSDTGI